MSKNEKVRVNVSVDKKNLELAKKKLGLFGGKLSTLFNRYLEEFVQGFGEKFGENQQVLKGRLDELERRVEKIEEKS